MGRVAVKVCVRTRPTNNFAAEEILIDEDSRGLTVNQKLPHDDGPLQNRNTCFHFPVHQVLHNVGQETVYDTYCRDVVQGAIDGVNGTIFTYGQTGSGKTFTMIGDTNNYVHRGIAPRALAQIFQEVQARTQVAFKVTVTYMEIHNERIFDLVDDVGNKELKTDFNIVEERGGRGIFARGLSEYEIHSEEEALNLLFSGELRRTTAQHKLNRKSNRSHSIFTIYISQKAKTGVSERVVVSKLNLVDLAGSERLKKTMDSEDPTRKYDDTIKKESMYINQSLSYLEQCVVSLLRKGGAHVPYRQSKLTNLLKDSIGGNCSTLMVACIWGEGSQIEETLSTLRFASRMTKVQNQAKAVEVLDTDQLIRKQDKLIKELKQELLMHDALAERTETVVYDPYTPEQQADIRRLCERYLRAPKDEEDGVLVFQSLRQMREMCRQFKMIVTELTNYAQASAGVAAAGRIVTPGGPAGQGVGMIPSSVVASVLGGGAGGAAGHDVGEEEAGHGFVLGRSLDYARPSSVDRDRPQGRAAIPNTTTTINNNSSILRDSHINGFTTTTFADTTGPFDPSMTKDPRADTNLGFTSTPEDITMAFASDSKERAYQMYREGPGKGAYATLLDTKGRLKETRALLKERINQVNDAKREIDSVRQDLEQKRSSKRFSESKVQLTEDMVDEEEFGLIKRDHALKKQYREWHEEYQHLKMSANDLEEQVEEQRADLYQEFERWYMDVRRTAALTTGDDSLLDKLDTCEQFQQLEIERIAGKDPNALAYFQAQKTMRATMTQSAVSLRQQHKAKRHPR